MMYTKEEEMENLLADARDYQTSIEMVTAELEATAVFKKIQEEKLNNTLSKLRELQQTPNF